MAAWPVERLAGRGASVPFVEYEAENARTNGAMVGPDRTFTTIAAEASGRRAVRLGRPGDYVEFTLAAPADALTVRAAVPDSVDGRGLDGALEVTADGRRLGLLRTTSRYGWFYGRYPFTNRASDGRPHHMFDESRMRLSRVLPAGTVLRLALLPGGTAPWCVVDLADFELVEPPLEPPAHALDIRGFGADPAGLRDSTAAIQRAVAAGRRAGRPVWIPSGDFRVTRHIKVDRVELAGAGPWYAVLRGPGVGVYGRTDGRMSRRVVLRGFAIMGEVTERVDHAQLNGVGGAMGDGSTLSNLWIQHTKAGLWFDGPMDGITISGLRLLDLTADGINFHRGVSHAVVENTFVRNSGDDGLAAWSHREADHHISFRHNTVVSPILANGIAVYGGRDISVEGNLVADTVTQGGGLHVGNRFFATPVAGVISLEHNLVLRSGSLDPNWRYGVGALWFYALDAPMSAAVRVRNIDLIDSTLEAIQVHGKPVTGLDLDEVRIDGAGSFALQVQAPGAGRFAHMTARGLGAAGVYDCGSGFQVERGDGDAGWETTACPPHTQLSPAR